MGRGRVLDPQKHASPRRLALLTFGVICWLDRRQVKALMRQRGGAADDATGCASVVDATRRLRTCGRELSVVAVDGFREIGNGRYFWPAGRVVKIVNVVAAMLLCARVGGY